MGFMCVFVYTNILNFGAKVKCFGDFFCVFLCFFRGEGYGEGMVRVAVLGVVGWDKKKAPSDVCVGWCFVRGCCVVLVASGVWVEPFGDVEAAGFVVTDCGVVVDVVHVVAPYG